MVNLPRREFLRTATVAALASWAFPSLAAPHHQRVFIGSGTQNGILAFDWDPVNGTLTADGIAARLANVDWIAFSPDRKSLYAASDVDSFQGKQTGAIARYGVSNGKLSPQTAQNSAGPGTCHLCLDHTGRVLISADYSGGSAASFLISEDGVSPAVWSEHYTGHGPNVDRQQSAHAHFASVSPNNRFVYINDLGGDCIHIYKLNATTAVLSPLGSYQAKAGSGPRTLHFHPNERTAYSVNELDSTVDVLEWSSSNGSLALISRIELLPAGYHGPTRACDMVISRSGTSVYFANRDKDFLYSFQANAKTGSLTPIGRSSCGGKAPRNFVLDPTERWMLVANQDSNAVSVFERDSETGAIAQEGISYTVATPMCILFA